MNIVLTVAQGVNLMSGVEEQGTVRSSDIILMISKLLYSIVMGTASPATCIVL